MTRENDIINDTWDYFQDLDRNYFEHTPYFNPYIDAFKAYKDAKERYIKYVAMDYYNNKLISEAIFNSLMKWEVEITD